MFCVYVHAYMHVIEKYQFYKNDYSIYFFLLVNKLYLTKNFL